jgi:Holliday junction resolvase
VTRCREETHLQAAVEAELRLRGRKYMHHHDSRRSVRGWPDVFAVKGSRSVAIEIKTMTGCVSREQAEWLDALNVAGIEALVVRLPRDWARIAEVLR